MIVTIVGTSIVAVGNSFLLTLVFISFAIFQVLSLSFLARKQPSSQIIGVLLLELT